MKIAVLSDIHSNLFALKMALNSLKDENIDRIYFLGDYITDGENENEILNIVKNVSDLAILGNREKYMLDYSPLRKDFNNYKTISMTYHNLNKESKEYIQSLPETSLVRINDYSILLLHGDKYFRGLTNFEEAFDKVIADFDFDICLFGHTHKYISTKYKEKYFINPGSIGEPCDYPTYKYCILDIAENINVKLKEFATQDTFTELASNYRQTEYYKNNYVWGNLILFIIRDGVDYCSLFLKLFNDRIKKIGELNSFDFNRIWNETYEEFIKDNNLIANKGEEENEHKLY